MRTRLVVLPAAVVLASAMFWCVPADAAPSLIGWTARADANPFDFTVDNSSGLGGFHPLVEVDIPEDSSDFETGPFGNALASLFWPGSVAGNLGSTGGLLGLPSQLAPLLSQLNDPVRAETFYPEGPLSASYPSSSSGGIAEMTSHADGNGTWAKAGLSDLSIPGVFEVQGVQGSTTATATTSAQSTAAGSFSSLGLLGGLLQIGASSSTASATSDGLAPNGTTTSHIGAITIAGHTVSFGSDGLVVGPAETTLLGTLLAPPTVVVDQLISLFNLTITPLPQSETRQAPAEEITSAGLKIGFALPPSATLKIDCSFLPAALAQLTTLCHLPDELQGLSFTATIARVTATAIATPPFPAAASPGASGAGSTAPTSINPGSSNGGAGPATSLIPATTQNPSPALANGPPSAPAAIGSQRSQPSASLLSPASLTSPVKAGLLGTLLVLAVLAAAGLRRIRRVLEMPMPSACPLEEQQ